MVEVKSGTKKSYSPHTLSQEQREIKSYILACLLTLSSISLFLHMIQHPCLGNGSTHSGLSLPIAINIRQYSTNMSTAQPIIENSLVRLSHLILSFIKANHQMPSFVSIVSSEE